MSWMVASSTTIGVMALLTPWLLRSAPQPTVPATPTAAITSPTAAVTTAPATGSLAAPRSQPAASAPSGSRELQLPDGSVVPTLNDAVDAAPIAQFWGSQPWSPIVGVERSSAGLDWYKHADGSYSTTQMVWRSDLGRHAAMTRVAHPGPVPAPAAAPR